MCTVLTHHTADRAERSGLVKGRATPDYLIPGGAEVGTGYAVNWRGKISMEHAI